MYKKVILFGILWMSSSFLHATTQPVSGGGDEKIRIRVGQRLSGKQKDLVLSARKLLAEASVSYVYGGGRLGTASDCAACNQCLESERPGSSRRLRACPECGRCSLDCSHFTQLVFERAGIQHPYLTSRDMVSLSGERLARDFGFTAMAPDPGSAIPGDLLVYKGHVVIVERRHTGGKGDVIHATGGRDIREPGQGIQRERWADLGHFRGPLLRILRHKSLVSSSQVAPTTPQDR
jgi:cell wall-associated NlpC family hydrolase